VNLGWSIFHMGDYVDALAHFAESMNLAYELNYPNAIAMSLLGAASALTRLRQPHQAAKLLGAADAIHASLGIVMSQSHEPEYARTCAELQEHLGGENFDHYWQVGRSMTVVEATTLANQCNGASAILPLAL
jgi:hypothetical protein